MTKCHFWLISPLSLQYKTNKKVLADFCLLVYKFETFCGVFIQHLAPLVQPNCKIKKEIGDTLLCTSAKFELFLFQSKIDPYTTSPQGCAK